MESGILHKIINFTADEKIAFRKKAIIFTFFLVLSVIFWFMNVLSKNYVATINYPVRYIDIPEGKVLIGDTPDYLSLKVSTIGYRIIRHKLSSRYLPLTFSVSSFSLNTLPGTDSSIFFIQTRFSREYLVRQLSTDFNISEIRPDTLFFRFASTVEAKLPVKPDIVFEPDGQMILKGLIASDPDSVFITGPDYVIDTMQAVYTRQKKLGTLSKSWEGSVDIKEMENITVNQDRVKVMVAIERITEKMLPVPVEVINIPDTVRLKTFPSFVEVSCLVGLSNFPGLQPTAFRIVANFDEISQGNGKLSLSLVKQPGFVRAVKVSPKNVEFLIEK